MKTEDKKAAVAAYRERKATAGVYVIHCAAADQQWAGAALDPAGIWNRVSFALRHGNDPRAALQAAWLAHGADSFTFEVVERVAIEDLVYGRDRALRDRRDHWCTVLGAAPI